MDRRGSESKRTVGIARTLRAIEVDCSKNDDGIPSSGLRPPSPLGEGKKTAPQGEGKKTTVQSDGHGDF
ncbi:MAG TPA: hypothetical protein DIW81_28700 [Planctomycetaceae bacterium]|nr:hypothetical protein [Planctomycetaceae bacterium]